MTKQRCRIFLGAPVLAVAAFLAAVTASTGQQPMADPKSDYKESGSKKESDPTVPGPGLKEVLTTPKEGKTVQPKTSEFRLRGRAISKQSSLVFLEIDGFNYLLPVGGEARSVKVLEITNSGVKVEMAPRKEIRVLH